jgi:CheY-like chemotaxis protein
MATLLVIDDDPAWRSLYRLEFERKWDVVEAQDGLEGLILFDALAPDLVILDLHMPRMDGLAFLAELSLRGSTVPVILCTGVLPQAGPPPSPCAGIVEKSPNLRELRSAIRAVLSPDAPHFVFKPRLTVE